MLPLNLRNRPASVANVAIMTDSRPLCNSYHRCNCRSRQCELPRRASHLRAEAAGHSRAHPVDAAVCNGSTSPHTGLRTRAHPIDPFCGKLSVDAHTCGICAGCSRDPFCDKQPSGGKCSANPTGRAGPSCPSARSRGTRAICPVEKATRFRVYQIKEKPARRLSPTGGTASCPSGSSFLMSNDNENCCQAGAAEWPKHQTTDFLNPLRLWGKPLYHYRGTRRHHFSFEQTCIKPQFYQRKTPCLQGFLDKKGLGKLLSQGQFFYLALPYLREAAIPQDIIYHPSSQKCIQH